MGILDTATRPLRDAGRIGGWAAGQGIQAFQRLRGGGGQNGARQQPQQRRSTRTPKDLDDVTIARKVETEIFRTRGVTKGAIDVNVVDGVAYLRGTAKTPAQIDAIETKARTVPEVREVQNLLHLPKTPAATRADTPRRQQTTRRKKSGPPAKPRANPRSLNADKTSERTGESPTELAKKRAGRQPAKLGS